MKQTFNTPNQTPKNYQPKSSPSPQSTFKPSTSFTDTLQYLYAEFIPNLSHSSLKLYIYYTLQSSKPDFNNKLDLVDFCETSNTSPRASYIALSDLKKKSLIPNDTTFTNTYQINSYQK